MARRNNSTHIVFDIVAVWFICCERGMDSKCHRRRARQRELHLRELEPHLTQWTRLTGSVSSYRFWWSETEKPPRVIYVRFAFGATLVFVSNLHALSSIYEAAVGFSSNCGISVGCTFLPDLSKANGWRCNLCLSDLVLRPLALPPPTPFFDFLPSLRRNRDCTLSAAPWTGPNSPAQTLVCSLHSKILYTSDNNQQGAAVLSIAAPRG